MLHAPKLAPQLAPRSYLRAPQARRVPELEESVRQLEASLGATEEELRAAMLETLRVICERAHGATFNGGGGFISYPLSSISELSLSPFFSSGLDSSSQDQCGG